MNWFSYNQKHNQKFFWVIVGVIAGAVATYLVVAIYQQPGYDPIPPTVTIPTATTEVSGFGTEVERKPAAAEVNYETALEQYRDFRIQFDNCVAKPTKVTYKNNTKVMLDNRSPDPQEIRIGNSVYRLWGYEFKIVTLYSAKLPATLSVDCQWLGEPAYNIGEILLQS